MSQENQHSKASPTKARILFTRGYFFLALMLAFALGSAGQTAEAQSPTVFVASRIAVSGLPIYGSGRTLTICKGEKITKTVLLKIWTSRIDAVMGVGGWSAGMQKISASSSNSQVATISPGTNVTGVGPSSPAALTQFTIKGVDVGSTLITFSDGGSLLPSATYDRPRADPRFMHVDVKECAFEVTAVSKWRVPIGFQPIITAKFTWLIQPDRDGKFDERNVLVSTSAVLGQHYFASGYTKEEIKAFASAVRIEGQVSWDTEEIDMSFTYDPVRVKMDLTCPSCAVIPAPFPGGHVDDPYQPYAEISFGPIAGYSDSRHTHGLQYMDQYGAIQTTTGQIDITVVRIYK